VDRVVVVVVASFSVSDRLDFLAFFVVRRVIGIAIDVIG
jgi:hypothetical protein